MGHAHGIKWDNNLIRLKIKEVVECLNLKRMPSRSECDRATGSSSLSNKISKTGGFYKWADRMGLDVKVSDTKTGTDFENKVIEFLSAKGYGCNGTSVRHPFDICLSSGVKIDAKISKLCRQKSGNFYQFNLEKLPHTCDLYILCCINDNGDEKMYIIPSKLIKTKHLSIGEVNSKYNKFIDRWDYVERYNKFYLSIV